MGWSPTHQSGQFRKRRLLLIRFSETHPSRQESVTHRPHPEETVRVACSARFPVIPRVHPLVQLLSKRTAAHRAERTYPLQKKPRRPCPVEWRAKTKHNTRPTALVLLILLLALSGITRYRCLSPRTKASRIPPPPAFPQENPLYV